MAYGPVDRGLWVGSCAIGACGWRPVGEGLWYRRLWFGCLWVAFLKEAIDSDVQISRADSAPLY